MGDFGGGKGGREERKKKRGGGKGVTGGVFSIKIFVQFGCLLQCSPGFGNSNTFFLFMGSCYGIMLSKYIQTMSTIVPPLSLDLFIQVKRTLFRVEL